MFLRSTVLVHYDIAHAAAFAPNGATVYVGTKDAILRVLDAATGKITMRLDGHAHWINSIAVSPSGLVATGSGDKSIVLWTQSSGKRIRLQGHTSGVRALAFSPDGFMLASTARDNSLRLWDPLTGTLLHTFEHKHSQWPIALAFSPDGRLIASAGRDGTLKLWDAVVRKHVLTVSDHQGWVKAVAFSPDGHSIVSGANDRTIRVRRITVSR